MRREDSPNDAGFFHGGWDDPLAAAHAAGRCAARQLARRCAAWELARPGWVSIRIEPVTSPFAAWLVRRGGAEREPDGSGVRMLVQPTAEDLLPAADATRKAESMLVARACAAAVCTVLAEQGGVSATVSLHPVPRTAERSSAPPDEASTERGTFSLSA